MKPEAQLYQWFKERFMGEWLRIENAISSGMPDCAVLYNGQTFWIELKVGPEALLRPAQHVWHLHADRQGVKPRIVHLYPNKITMAFYVGNTPRTFNGKYWKVEHAYATWIDRRISNATKIHDVLFSSSP